MTLPLATEANGAKNAKSGRVSLRLRRVRSALTHVKARMGRTLTERVTFEYRARTDACASRRCTPRADVLGLAEMIQRLSAARHC